jgi:hypothetical protein
VSATRAERRFFSGYTLAILLAIVIGFAPSFFLRGLVEPFLPLKPLRPAVLVHAVLTTAWVLLFPLQAWLIAAGSEGCTCDSASSALRWARR